jgi:hypothetical protein
MIAKGATVTTIRPVSRFYIIADPGPAGTFIDPTIYRENPGLGAVIDFTDSDVTGAYVFQQDNGSFKVELLSPAEALKKAKTPPHGPETIPSGKLDLEMMKKAL